MNADVLRNVAWLSIKAALRVQRLQVHVNQKECSAVALQVNDPVNTPSSVAATAAYLTGDRMRRTYPTGTYETRTQKSECSFDKTTEYLIFRVAGFKAVVSFAPFEADPLKGILAVVDGVVEEI